MTTIYRSTDVSAPVLTGEAGKLTDLLYACLVTGYGAMSGSGWARSFVDAPNSTSVFKQPAGSGFYLRVDDGGPGAATYKEARAVGYETMSGVDTGVSPFPTVVQATNGVFIRKSASADATARAWILAATDSLFHLFVFNGDVASVASVFSFGDIYSYKPGDAYSAHISGRTTENASTTTGESVAALAGTLATTTAGMYISRSYSGIGGSVATGKHSDGYTAAQTIVGKSGVAYPSPVDGGMVMTPLYIHEASVTRGTIPGLWNPVHDNSFGLGDIIGGVGGIDSKSFEVVSVSSTSTGQVLLETTAWNEN